MIRTLLSTLVLTAAVTGSALAAPPADRSPGLAPAPVYCATFTVFQFRAPAYGQQPEARSLYAMDVINKFLGGSVGKVTTRPAGKNVRLMLNNELVALVTPADATAEKAGSASALAAKWAKELSKAFNASKAQP